MSQAGQLGLFAPTTALYRRADGRGVPHDICERKHGGNPQSTEANKAVAPTKEQTRREVLAWFIGRGRHGGTADECVVAFGSNHNHIAPRVSELRGKNQLVPNGTVRKTRQKKNAAVLVAKEFAGN